MAKFGDTPIIQYIRRNGVRFLIGIISVLILIAAGLLEEYFRNFHHGYSTNSNDWSNFGQYISGVFSIALSFINLLILIYVAYTAAKGDQDRWETDLRIANFKELLQELGKINTKTTSGTKVTDLKGYLEITDLNNYYYLSGREEAALKKIQYTLIEKLGVTYKSLNPITELRTKKSFNGNLLECLELKEDMTKMLGSIILRRVKTYKLIVDKYLNEDQHSDNSGKKCK
jgi:hypothetical protein